MAVMTTAGSTLSIGTAAATIDAAGFGAVSYTAVGEITDIGEFGKEFNLVTHNPIGNRQTKKFKGSFNNGSLQLQLAFDSADTGQDYITGTALGSDDSFSIKIVLQSGLIEYFTAKVMSFRINPGSVDSITSATVMLEIDSSIVEV
jgi:hypothetical protein